MATTTGLITVADFRQMPEDHGEVYHELRHGEAVAVARPKLRHALIQRTLRRLLEDVVPANSYVDVEVAFRPLPEYELWVADVAWLCPARFATTDRDDNIAGAPELVIEVLSPSNTVEEMNDREKICLENGTREFWAVDPKRQQVRVSAPDGHAVTYRSGQQIP